MVASGSLLLTARRACWIAVVVSMSATFAWAACPAGTTPAECPPWVATWGTAQVAAQGGRGPDLSDETLRLIVHTSVGGPQVRVWLSNRFSTDPLHIGGAHIGLSLEANPAPKAENSSIKPGSDRVLTFNHMTSVTIPPGATIVSDPATLDVPALSDIAVSLYLPETSLTYAMHGGAQQTSYAAAGNVVDASSLAGKSWPVAQWYILSAIDVYAPGASAVVAFGDSITDGNHSTPSANHRWPDYLAARLAADPVTSKAGVLGVVNEGISGNRVLLDGDGPNGMSRVQWDILAQSGVKYLILFHGINDIESLTRSHKPRGDIAERLEWALANIAAQAHEHGIVVFGATQMTDCRNMQCAWPEGEMARQALNQWIRTTDVFDGMIDFDAVMRDPEHTMQMLPAYDSGDEVHPNDLGYKAMADAIDLKLFSKKLPDSGKH